MGIDKNGDLLTTTDLCEKGHALMAQLKFDEPKTPHNSSCQSCSGVNRKVDLIMRELDEMLGKYNFIKEYERKFFRLRLKEIIDGSGS